MSTTVTLDLHVMLDADGNHIIGAEADDAADTFEEAHGAPTMPVTIYSIALEVPTPTAHAVKAKIEAPASRS